MTILMAGCFRWIKRRNQQAKDIKLVIIGLDDAGKTTTIASLQGEPPDGITPTVGFSNADITMGKSIVTIYDLGGGANVRSVWQKYYAEIYGMIFAVDSGDHNRLSESKTILNEIFNDPKVKGKPIVIFANKQDKEGALSEQEVSEKLSLEELSNQYAFKFKVFSCSAIQGYGKAMDKRIRMGLNWLLTAINEDYSIINEKVTKESAIQREQEQQEKRERLERMRKLREEREKAAAEAGVVEDEEESDDDVVTNPFRNINDQVEVTKKREKKAKEKLKKIKDFQSKKNTENCTEEVQEDEEEDEMETDAQSIKGSLDRRKSTGSMSESKHFSSRRNSSINVSDTDNVLVKEKSRKKKKDNETAEGDIISAKKRREKNKKKDRRNSNIDGPEVSNTNEIMKEKNCEVCMGIDENLICECSKLSIDNVCIGKINKNKHIKEDVLPHNIIQVSSKENIRENSPPPKVKKKKKIRSNDELLTLQSVESSDIIGSYVDTTKSIKKKKKSMQHNINDYCMNDSSEIKSEKEINDSRAELFLARSNESLDRRDHEESNCCNNKLKGGKKKKRKESSTDFHNVQETNVDGKKKIKKKSNKTEPQLASTSYVENNISNGNLLPLRGGSKLEPIKGMGKLPRWSNAEESSIPSWAMARPNFDDDDVIT